MPNLPRGTPDQLPLEVLHLDKLNPRLPEDYQGRPEPDLLTYIAREYAPLELGRSIALHGYFLSEPLIVMPDADGFIVIEGNRRLVALRILADPALAERLDDAAEWRELARRAALPDRIPVIKVENRQEVAPIIGFRHIAGIEPWDPYAKARFISALLDAKTEPAPTFDSVSELVGENRGEVISAYRNQKLVEQARDQFQLDAHRAIRRFGVFTRAMNAPNLRGHVGLTTPVPIGAQAVPADKQENVKELFSWLFGENGTPPVINESRDITELGTVVGSADGLEVLRETRDLDAAYAASGGLKERLLRRLHQSLTSLQAAREDINAYRGDDDVKDELERCRQALDSLLNPDA